MYLSARLHPVLTIATFDCLDDNRIVTEHYEGIKAHLDNTRKLVNNKTGLLTYSRYGDWCAAAVAGQVGCSYTSSLVSTFYLILELDIVSEMAPLVGQTTDFQTYSTEACKFIYHRRLIPFGVEVSAIYLSSAFCQCTPASFVCLSLSVRVCPYLSTAVCLPVRPTDRPSMAKFMNSGSDTCGWMVR